MKFGYDAKMRIVARALRDGVVSKLIRDPICK